MFSNELSRKIEEFVYSKPRSMQEIASHIGKNWRTADRYVSEIENNFGTISTKVFREGTRGALKIAYWSSVEKASSSVFQEKLEEEILRAKRKEDFSAFDIFQFVNEKNKQARIETELSEEKIGFQNIKSLFEKAERQLLIFSGNLSFINFRKGKTEIFDIIEQLARRGISRASCRSTEKQNVATTSKFRQVAK